MKPGTKDDNSKRLRWFALGALVVAFASGCRADVNVDVEIEDNGSGVVTAEVVLDQEAADAVLDLSVEADGLPLRDLADAGWVIDPPASADPGTTIRASKSFGTTAQFSDVMDELSSGTGLFRDFKLQRSQSFGRLDYSVTGMIDTNGGFSAFSDTALQDALGRSLQSIADYYGAELSDLGVTMQVTLPGELQEDASTGLLLDIASSSAPAADAVSVDPGAEELGSFGEPELRQRAQWQANFTTPTRTEVVLSTSRRSISAQVLRGVAVVAGVLASLILFARLVRLASGRSRRRPPPKPRPADALGRTPEQVAAEEAAKAAVTTGEHRAIDVTTGAGAEFPYRVVALDGMGVLYREGNDIQNLLIPFARDGGSIAPAEEIAAKARLVSLGRLTSADFWQLIGVAGDPNQLDAAYLANHQLMPGVVKYLRALRDRNVRAACITNDGSRWATKLRASHPLEGLIDQWVVSGSVGVRKPDAPIYEVLRRVVKEPANAILVIDDDLDALDAARRLGFGTAWFAPDGDRSMARDHMVLRRFEAESEDDEAGLLESPKVT